MRFKSVPFARVEHKVDLEKRTVELYSSVVDTLDLGGDIILSGAFKNTLSKKRDEGSGSWRIPLLWQHDQASPIGRPLVLEEDSKGLHSVDYIPDTQKGTEALVLAREGIVWGASIGYNAVKHNFNDAGVRTIAEVELFERSLVTFPMNEAARVVAVKQRLTTLSPAMQRKIGRVLKESNLEKLQEALDLIQEVIDSALPPPEEGDLMMGEEEDACNPKKPRAKKGAVPFKSFGVDDDPWDGPKEVAAASVEDLRTMAAWFDSEAPDLKGSYKLPHHRQDGYAVSRAGVQAAMGALLGARGGVDLPEGDREAVYNHLARHYSEDLGSEPPEMKTAAGDPENEAAAAELAGALEAVKGLFRAR